MLVSFDARRTTLSSREADEIAVSASGDRTTEGLEERRWTRSLSFGATRKIFVALTAQRNKRRIMTMVWCTVGLGSFLARSFEAESFAKLYRNFALKLLVEETSFQVAKLAQMTLNLFTVIKVLIISKFLILSYWMLVALTVWIVILIISNID